MTNLTDKSEHLYLRIAGILEQKIRSEIIPAGQKLPSLRKLCSMYNISQSTAMQAYYYLENRSLVEARPQSGYFVSGTFRKKSAIPAISQPPAGESRDIDDILEELFRHMGLDMVMFSHGVPALEHLPVAKLNKSLIQAAHDLKGSGIAYELAQGNQKLRRNIARQAYWQGYLNENDIVTTTGCIGALSASLMAVTQPGDTIITESPVYFGILQLTRQLGLKVLELPTHPVTGIAPDTLKEAFSRQKISACLLVSNFSNPLGSCMPDEHKKEVVRLIQHYNVPLIEDDIYGDVYFGKNRPLTCKSFDDSGLVLWCGSVSKTLAPGHRVGWVAPGKFKDAVIRMKTIHSISSTSITQEVIAHFLETGRYENHLRKLRQTLYGNYTRFVSVIQEYFPQNTRIGRPQGGFVLWIEFDRRVDAGKLFKLASKEGISVSPGNIFTLRDQFNHCIRLNFGMVWNEKVRDALIRIGKMAGELMNE